MGDTLAQGVYNQLLLVPIVGRACFPRHQLATIFNASFSLSDDVGNFNRMGREGDFCYVAPTDVGNVMKMAV